MARKKRSSKSGCGCPSGSTMKRVGNRGTRCVQVLSNGRWKFHKKKC
jgi:hypothetical protein